MLAGAGLGDNFGFTHPFGQQGQDLRNVMLAGGLGADNCVEAAKSGCAGLDFNSGVESQPGMKDASKLASVFQTLRAY